MRPCWHDDDTGDARDMLSCDCRCLISDAETTNNKECLKKHLLIHV